MREQRGDIWELYDAGKVIGVTTNGVVRSDGACVMGRGIALQAKKRFPKLPYAVGNEIKADGNNVHFFPKYRIYSFPTKHAWNEDSDPELIEESCKQLVALANKEGWTEAYLVRPGCSNGNLLWDDVKVILERHFDDRFVIVDRNADACAG